MSERDESLPNNAGQSPGALLVAGRKTRELTIEEVGDALNLAPQTVQWLEADNFAALPAAAFTQGYIRNYAKLVRLDADAVVLAYQNKAGKPAVAWESPPSAAGISELVQRHPGLLITAVVAAVVLLIIIVLAIVWPDEESSAEVVDESLIAGAVVADSAAATPGVGTAPTTSRADSAGSASSSLSGPTLGRESGSAARAVTATEAGRRIGRFDSPTSTFDREAIDPNDPLAHLPVAKTYPVDSVGQSNQAPALADDAAQRDVVADAEPLNSAASGNYRLNISQRLTPTGDNQLRLEVAQDCWIAIKNAAGDPLYAQLGRPGQTIKLTGQGPFRVLLGYAPGAVLYLDDRQIELVPYTRNNVASLVIGQ